MKRGPNFIFRNKEGSTGSHAKNIEEFHRELKSLATDSLLHHVRRHDFSRWFREAIQDEHLGEEIFIVEMRANDPDSSIDVEKLRRDTLAAINDRYFN